VKRLLGGTYAAFASREIAERVAGRVSGTIFPFAFDPELELVEPPALHPRADLVLDLPRTRSRRSSPLLKLRAPKVRCDRAR
jgi:Ala-tRNA(Pro) deacylase